jgi:electron-transferring-flavoprotein dehydrogenase
VKKELSVVRNVLPLVEKYGDLAGTILSGITMWLETLKIKVPFTMKHHPDNESLYRADIMPKPDYPKPDGVLTFDRLSSVFVSNTNHEEDQPVHLAAQGSVDPGRVQPAAL